METLVSTTDSQTLPWVKAIEFMKEGNIEGACEVLCIPPDSVAADDFAKAMMALERGLLLCAQAAYAESVPYFQAALPIIERSADEGTKSFVRVLAMTAQGISCILAGEPRAAGALFEEVDQIVEKLAFYNPELRKVAIDVQLLNHVAAARVSLNVGDLSAGEACLGRGRTACRQLLSLLRLDDAADHPFFLDAFGVPLQGAITFATMDLQFLDLETAQQRVAGVERDATGLQQVLEVMSAGPLQALGALNLRLYNSLRRLIALYSAVIFERSPADQSRINEFKNLGEELFKLKQRGLDSGQAGQSFVVTVRLLDRYRQNLLILDGRKANSVDKQRGARLATFISLIAFMIVGQLTFQPSGIVALVLFSGELLASLIVGFGYGALRFQRLLSQYNNLVPRAGAPKTED
jgi:hypothetical protein